MRDSALVVSRAVQVPEADQQIKVSKEEVW